MKSFLAFIFVIKIVISLDCNLNERCKVGSLIEVFDAPDSIRCLSMCQDNEECKFYTFHKNFDNFNCDLFRKCESTQACDQCISGEPQCINCDLKGLCLVIFFYQLFHFLSISFFSGRFCRCYYWH